MRNVLGILIACIGLSSCATAQNTTNANVKTDSIAEKMLVYQLSNGGWPKQLEDKSVVKYEHPLTEALLQKIKATSALHATIDNNATSREINALILAYKQTANKAYLTAAEKGIDYLLKAQYANGGWPQYYPDKSSYRAEITYNDNAMINALTIMLNIVYQTNGFEVVNASYLPKAEKALKNGINCVLKTQVLQNGKPVIWAAQYDENTLKPAKARAFEPASLSTGESVGIVRFLMKLKNPSMEVKTAIKNAVDWFESTKIVGYKYGSIANNDKGLVADAQAISWARFYDLNTNKPVFGDRDNSVKASVEEISKERRVGYAWYGTFAQNLLAKEYPKWLKSNGG
ncbi:pectate lyase [Pedobacter chitinilyticus]|uniref:Pectate lyase n=1 Tax=Pedobacter chitinilyticus TaxID=2233776 RepID=A0A443Z1X8_9SPHI|nr:pectate lyase [Pedobacter chitinilyticus]RWU10526.1 pectate lyase [Pedobacter chitinilyticus]